ncbi:MAG: tetratricopeptide repeat protein [Fervidobacterium sp.]
MDAQTKKEYADWLYKQGDYFRAISEYKMLKFFSKNTDSINIFQYQIAKAYYKSGKHYNSIEEFVSLLERPISDELKSNCLNYIALNYLNLSLPNQALFYSKEALKIDTAKSLFTTGLIYANLYDWDKAKKYFSEVSKFSSFDSLSRLANYNLALLDTKSNAKQKSPLLALLLSAILPGAGQYYSEHYVDALQAFTFVSSFAYMSYIAYKYDHIRDKGFYNFGISIFITSLFYIANLIGAERTASYYNLKQNQDFVRRINEKSFLPFE